jgi:hypothetical protein
MGHTLIGAGEGGSTSRARVTAVGAVHTYNVGGQYDDRREWTR